MSNKPTTEAVKAAEEIFRSIDEVSFGKKSLYQKYIISAKIITRHQQPLLDKLKETEQAYQTVKDWAHRIENILMEFLREFEDNCDGAPDASPLAKFCNSMLSRYNDIQFRAKSLTGQQQPLLDALKEARDAIRLSKIKLTSAGHHDRCLAYKAQPCDCGLEEAIKSNDKALAKINEVLGKENDKNR